MDKSFWQAIRKSDYQVPEGFTVAILSQELLALLGSPDAELRDYSAFDILERWIAQGLYTEHQMRAMLWGLVGNLNQGLGKKDDDSVLLRSFSALVIAEILKYDNAHPFLNENEVHEVLDQSLLYLEKEQDLRGHLEGKGWAHAIAHTGDLLGVLARSRYSGRRELERLLSALAEKITAPVEHAYTTVEDERLALVAIMALTRDILDDGYWDWWFLQLTMPVEKINWTDTINFARPKDICAYHNTRLFLHALYFQLTLAKYKMKGVKEMVSKIIEALHELDAGFYAAEVTRILDPGLNLDDIRE